MPAAAPAPFEIAQHETPSRGVVTVATNGEASIQVDAAEGGRVWRRRGVKTAATGDGLAAVEWAVAELDGVRCYFDGAHAVLTRRDLLP